MSLWNYQLDYAIMHCRIRDPVMKMLYSNTRPKHAPSSVKDLEASRTVICACSIIVNGIIALCAFLCFLFVAAINVDVLQLVYIRNECSFGAIPWRETPAPPAPAKGTELSIFPGPDSFQNRMLGPFPVLAEHGTNQGWRRFN
jgi:hypothetical protein